MSDSASGARLFPSAWQPATSDAVTAQKILRAAAAAGNRMLAGSRIVFLSEPVGLAAPLLATLQNYAAQLRCRSVYQHAEAAMSYLHSGDSGYTDFVVCVSPQPGAATLITNIPEQLPPLYLPLPQHSFTNTEMFAAAYQKTAATLISHLQDLGFTALSSERTNILEFAVTGATKIPDAHNRLGQRLAVLTHLNFEVTTATAAGRLHWAARGMPATATVAQQMPQLDAERILVSLIIEPKTAALALLLKRAGAAVAVFAPANECDVTVAAELTAQGIVVFAPGGGADVGWSSDSPHFVKDATAQQRDGLNAKAALAWCPTLLIDDGSHLIRLVHTRYPETLKTLKGAAEETTSGVRPLLEMAAQNKLQLPVIAVNNARTKTFFDNRIGTGESCVHAILDVLDQPATVMPWVIWGYGPVGEGVARTAAAYGADVSVIEPDAVRAMQAVCDGYRVITEASLPTQPFIAVSATGVWHTIKAATMIQHWDNMTLAVAGGIDNEIAVDDLEAAGWSFVETAHPQIKRLQNPAGKVFQTRLLAAGGGINYTAAEGNPLEVMDLSFATQLAALTALLDTQHESQRLKQNGVHELPQSAEQLVAVAALRSRGLPVFMASENLRHGGAAQPWQIHRYIL